MSYETHVTHCCAYSCKYGDEDCPVANGKVLPKYRCEFCSCLQMNPGADVEADKWWSTLTAEQKASLYLTRNW